MLQYIRDRVQSWIAWFIIALITIPFALWGINQYFEGGGDIVAAQVNGVEIGQQRVQQAYYQQQERLRQMLGANYNPDMFPEEQMRRQALEGLIEQELLVQAAVESGMRIGDAYLAATIRGISAFQQDGQFSQEVYERTLRAQGMTSTAFEAQLRRDLLVQQLFAAIGRTEFATGLEQRELARLSLQQRDVGMLSVAVDNYLTQASVSDDEIAAYYDAQPHLFMQPEQVSIAYLDLSVEGIATGIEVNEEELRTRYQSQQASYQETEQRHARHILLTLPAEAEEAQVAQVRAKAEELLTQLRGGASFEALAKEHSEDPGSAGQGGDLGLFGRGVMDQAFEDAVFALKVGELSQPVRSAFGYHLIRLEAVRGGERRSFEQVREQILAEIRTERAEQQFYEQAEQLANLAYEHPDTLEEAARQLGLTIQKSALFSRRGGEGILSHSKLIAAAFSDDVLARGHNSEPLELDSRRIVVLRVMEHQPETRQPLQTVRAEIESRLKHDKAQVLARQAAEELREKIAAGAEPEVLAKSGRMVWQRQTATTRGQVDMDAQILRTAFAMPRPGDQKSTVQLTTSIAGDPVVVVLYQVHDTVPGTDAVAGDTGVERASSDAMFLAMTEALRSRADITRPDGAR